MLFINSASSMKCTLGENIHMGHNNIHVIGTILWNVEQGFDLRFAKENANLRFVLSVNYRPNLQ